MAASPPVSDNQPRPDPLPARLLVVMGVSGVGKTTIGKALAAQLDAIFLEGDDYHSAANIQKMTNGIALTDEDRWPWLTRFAQAMSRADGQVVGACSTLKRCYRDHLQKMAGENAAFVYLDANLELVHQRLSERSDHFMPSSLLHSQYASLEPPEEDELAVHVSINDSAESVASNALAQLNQLSKPSAKNI